jgi:hypothetical protein
VEAEVKPVPKMVSIASVAIGPAITEIDVRVGTGGLVTLNVIAFEVGLIAVGQFAVMLADPAVVSNEAGTVP